MAERASPPGEKPNDDDHPPNDDPNSHASDTYVIQVPKEQIYRFPTPENAKLAEKYHEQSPKKNPWISLLLRFLGCLLFVAIILGLIAVLIYFIVNPTPPQFTVDSFRVKKSNNRHLQRRHHHFDIRLTSDNTNHRMGILYQEGGTVNLIYKLQKIASGEPKPSRSSKHSATFKLCLSDSQALLPKKILRSMDGKGPKGGLPLSLSIVIPVKLNIAGSLWAKRLVGECHLKVGNLKVNTHILSQNCDVRIA